MNLRILTCVFSKIEQQTTKRVGKRGKKRGLDGAAPCLVLLLLLAPKKKRPLSVLFYALSAELLFDLLVKNRECSSSLFCLRHQVGRKK